MPIVVRVVLFDELPDWVEKDRLSNNGSGREWASYLLIEDGPYRVCYSDAMEPEDAKFLRDLSWIQNEIGRAYRIPRRPFEMLHASKELLETPLTLEIAAGQLQVRIGLQTLKHAAENSDSFNPFNDASNDFKREFKVSDYMMFAKGIINFLKQESEEGSTVLTRALEAGFVHAIENADGVDEVEIEDVQLCKKGEFCGQREGHEGECDDLPF